MSASVPLTPPDTGVTDESTVTRLSLPGGRITYISAGRMQARPPKYDGRHGRDPDPARCAAGDRSRRTRGGARGSPVPIARRRHWPWGPGGVATARGGAVWG